MTAGEATAGVSGLSGSAKNELLFERGINFDALPVWQKRGACVRWGTVVREGHNPVTGETTEVLRRTTVTDFEIPRGEAFADYVRTEIEKAQTRT